MTKDGIEINLRITPWIYEEIYDSGQVLEFRFSSEFYLKKFKEKQEGNRFTVNASLSNRFNFKIINDILCDITLYKKIEKRGFLIIMDGEELWLDDPVLIGDKLTKKK